MSEKPIEAMKYNDLKALAASKGLDASGTKEVLQARLKEVSGQPEAPASEPAATPATPAPAAEGVAPAVAPVVPATPADEPVRTQTTPQEEKALEKSAVVQLRRDAQEMKEALEKQPVVSIMIPFEAGESPENGKKIPFHVNLNGYMKDYPRGQYIDVPRQIADIIKERLESEGKIGAQWRLDRDPKKMEALG